MPEVSAVDIAILSRLTGEPAAAIARSTTARAMGEMLVRDGLTGLYNRRYLQERLPLEFARVGGTGARLALLVMDLNGFKGINDTLGHEAGDRLLTAAAQVLRQTLPPEGFAVRYGGDEFVAVLPGLRGEPAEEVARRIADRLTGVKLAGGSGHTLPGLSVSIGIAVWPDDAADYTALFAAADRAMYHAKLYRPGRACRFTEIPPPQANDGLRPGVGDAPGDAAVLCVQIGHAAHPARAGDRSADDGSQVVARVTAGIHDTGGTLIRDQGAGGRLLALFSGAVAALTAALTIQRELRTAASPERPPPPVGMIIDVGALTQQVEGCTGTVLERCAQLAMMGHGGQILLSHAAAAAVGQVLPANVHLQSLGRHSRYDLQGAEEVFQLSDPELPAGLPPLRSLATIPNNLPLQLTRFVGRKEETAALGRLLGADRLVTLTGAGGAGKTRLALQVAAQQAPARTDGVWLVELAGVSELDGPVPGVAAVLGVREEPGCPLAGALADFLRQRQLLLVLDNCEHLIADCAALASTWLSTCPGLSLLVTSREPLGIPGEIVFRVPSLAFPDPLHRPALDQMARYEAVRLFCDRAAVTQPGFSLTAANAQAVAQICSRLDGIPLAIELAAARLNVLSVAEIAARLDDRFQLLMAGGQQTLPRQQTLRGAVDWSYDLLSGPERLLWHRLSVFAGSFSLATAEAVCSGDGLTEPEITGLLGRLVNKSLVIAEQLREGTRYRLLETIRQYGHERLQASGAESQLRARHRHWYLEWVEQAERRLQGRESSAWLDRLEQEGDNLRAALAWSQAQPRDAALSLRLATALGAFWLKRGNLMEGRERLTELLAGVPEPTATRGKALTITGMLAFAQGDFSAAEKLHGESLAIERELGDANGIAAALTGLTSAVICRGDLDGALALATEGLSVSRTAGDTLAQAHFLNLIGIIAMRKGEFGLACQRYRQSADLFTAAGDNLGRAKALNQLGMIALWQGDVDGARVQFEECLLLVRSTGDQSALVTVYNNLGGAYVDLGDFDRAEMVLQECLAVNRSVNNKRLMAAAVSNLGNVARGRGELDQAAARYAEALATFRALGDKNQVAQGAQDLGLVRSQLGDSSAALALWRESLQLRREMGDRKGIAESLAGLAVALQAQGRIHRAVVLAGAAAKVYNGTDATLDPAIRKVLERALLTARDSLGTDQFARAWARGEGMSLDQAMALALTETSGDMTEPALALPRYCTARRK